MTPQGDSATQITHKGGFAALPSLDGKYLYYAKGRDIAGLWRVPVDGGEEVKMFDGLPVGGWGYFAVTPDGIYYPDASNPALYFYSFTTQTSTLAMTVDHEQPCSGAPSIGFSPDGQTMLMCMQDQALVYIMLVENFRP